MTTHEFCFWLKGFMEDKETLPTQDIEKVSKKLQEVFLKVTKDSSPFFDYLDKQITLTKPYTIQLC